MMRIPGKLIAVALACLVGMGSAEVSAQGLRMATSIHDRSREDSTGKAPIVSTSLTLFHNGRIYDYVPATGEVVISDLNAQRFTILNTTRMLKTTLESTHILRLLESRESDAHQYVSELQRKGDTSSLRTAGFVAFQLQPRFQVSYDQASASLTMKSDVWTYDVATADWKDAEQRENYLAWADWTARLNYVLDPQSLYPAPRLALNNQLRQVSDRMPVSVDVHLFPDRSVHLQAVHKYTQKLDASDHRRIAEWESALRGSSLKALPFAKYQEVVLVSHRD